MLHIELAEEDSAPAKREAAAPLIDFVAALSSSLELPEVKAVGERLRDIAAESETAETDPRIAAVTGPALSRAERVEAMLGGLRRGFDRRRELLADALTAPRVAELVGWSRQTPHDRRRAGKLLAVESRGTWLFPAWQFDPHGPAAVVPGLPDVLAELRHLRPIDQLLWMETRQPTLAGRTPVEALKAGEVEVVQLQARSVGRS